jgi:4-hydroxybenzoate polyprenyltransferase
MIGEWIRVGRIHTAAMTMPITLLGYVLAGGRDPLVGFGWLVFALGWHYLGFLQNNLFDLKYDRLDPEKQHFPLVRGTVSPRTAWTVDVIGLALLFMLGSVLSNWSAMSIMLITVGYAAGTLYNAFSKVTLLKPIPIAVCFAVLPVIPYVSMKSFDGLILMMFVYVILMILYQIGYSGELKDIDRKERNILRVIDRYGGVDSYAATLKMLNLMVGFIIYKLVGGGWGLDILVIVLAVIIVVVLVHQMEDFKMWKSGNWSRTTALRNMSLMEILSYWYLVVCLMPILGLWSVLWIVLPLLWFIALNRFIFGTTIYPKV